MKKYAAIVACIGGAVLAWSGLVWRLVPELDMWRLQDAGMSLQAARWLFLLAREAPPLLLFLAGCGMLFWVARLKRSRLGWLLLAIAGFRGLVAAAGVVQFTATSEPIRTSANDIWVFGWFPSSLLLTVAAAIMFVEPLASAPLAKRTKLAVAACALLAAGATLLLGGPTPALQALSSLSLPLAAVLGRLGVPTFPVIYGSTAFAIAVLWYLVLRTAFAFVQRRKPQALPAGSTAEPFSAT